MLSEKLRSSLSDTRKVTKSTMEKKRRARINNSLVELKAILAGMVTHKGERFDKMEKADILEMTVDCVRQLQKQTRPGERLCAPSTSDSDYKSGIETCVGEVMRVLSSTEVDVAGHEMKSKLLTHISNRLCASPDQSVSFRSSDIAAISPRLVEFSERQQFTTSSRTHADMDNICETDGVVAGNMHDEDHSTLELHSASHPPPLLPGTVPRQISPVYTPIQAADNSAGAAGQSAASNVPVTILVPAMYTTQTGGTFFIPVAFSGATPYLSPQASVLDSNCSTISPGINAVISLPQVFSFSPSYTSNSNIGGSTISTNISPVIVYRDNKRFEDTTEHFAQLNNSQTQVPHQRPEQSNTLSLPTVSKQTSTVTSQLKCPLVYTPVAKRLEPPQGCAILTNPPVLNSSYYSQSHNHSHVRSAFLHLNHDRGDATDVSRARVRECNPDPEQAPQNDHSIWRPW